MEFDLDILISLLQCEVKGEKRHTVARLSPFFQAVEGDITFASEQTFLKNLKKTNASVIIVPKGIELPVDSKTYLIVEEAPRFLMPKLLKFFKKETKKMENLVEKTAEIDDSADIAPNVYIGHDTKIGKNVKIFPNSTIGEGVSIGDNTIIYSNVVIREFCKIGKNCIIQPGAIIGSDGFGYVKIDGKNTKVDHIGNVVLEDFVEIGANTTIDRGTIGDTIIKKYTKVDNLVQIAHNDIIGENCLIVSQVGIAGSTEIGDNTVLGGQVGIAGHIKIGSNVMIGAKSGVIGNVEDNQILSGNPLVQLKEDMKIKASLKRLPELIKIVKKIENIIKNNIIKK